MMTPAGFRAFGITLCFLWSAGLIIIVQAQLRSRYFLGWIVLGLVLTLGIAALTYD